MPKIIKKCILKRQLAYAIMAVAKKEIIKSKQHTPLSVARLGATTDKVYHNFFNLGILHSGVAYDIMPIGEKMK